jgi:hypothetical protein
MGGVDWAGPGGIRHPFHETRQVDADLPADQESWSGSVAAWARHRIVSTVRYLGIEVDDTLEIADKAAVHAHTAGS